MTLDELLPLLSHLELPTHDADPRESLLPLRMIGDALRLGGSLPVAARTFVKRADDKHLRAAAEACATALGALRWPARRVRVDGALVDLLLEVDHAASVLTALGRAAIARGLPPGAYTEALEEVYADAVRAARVAFSAADIGAALGPERMRMGAGLGAPSLAQTVS